MGESQNSHGECKKRKGHILHGPIYINCRKCRLTYRQGKERLLVGRYTGRGREWAGDITKRYEETSEVEGYVHYHEWIVSYVKTAICRS